MKNETNLKYQVSVFGDFSHISPSEETLKLCIESFFTLGMIPGGGIQEIDPRTSRLEPRLSLQSVRNGVVANFLNGRVDFFANPISGSPAASLKIEDFINLVSDVLRVSEKVFNLSYTRVGFVTERFFRELTAAELKGARETLVSSDAVLFPELNSDEWSVRVNASDKLDAPLSQAINVSYNISFARVQIGDQTGMREFDTIHLVVDINTPPDKRISSNVESLLQFLNHAKTRESYIKSAVREKVYAAGN